MAGDINSLNLLVINTIQNMIMTSQHFLNHVKQIIGRTFHIILFFDMITTYTQLYLVFGGIIDFYSQKIFMV